MIDQPIITLGSPYGIGYEIFLRSLDTELYNGQIPYCVGSESALRFFIKLLNSDVCYKSISSKKYSVAELNNIGDSKFILFNIDHSNYNIRELSDITERIDGEIAFKSIDFAADLVNNMEFSSVVTLAVSKKNINIIDCSFKGHTEFFQKKWGEESVFMTFISDKINVMLLTTHVPLKDICENITYETVKNALDNSVKLIKKIDGNKKICFCGINPHPRAQGLLGD